MISKIIKTTATFMVLLLLTADMNAADKIITDSQITEVKIYQSGATVTRKKKLLVDAGHTILRFENLPSAINPSGISVTATGNFTILSVTHQLDYLGPDRKTPEMISLEDSLKGLNWQRETVLNQIAALQEELNTLIANKSIGGANTGVQLEDLKNISTYVRERVFVIKERTVEYMVTEKKLKSEIDKLNKQLKLLNNKRNEPYSTIVVKVMASEKVNAEFTLSYFTGNVSWYPAYDIRVKDSNSPVDLELKAMVNQSTGEDWNNIRFTISNANPTIGQTKPELTPWYLNFLQHLKTRQLSSAPEKQLMEIQGAPEQEDAASASGMVDFVSSSETRFSTEYAVTIPYSIPSDGLHYAVQLEKYNLTAAYSYYVTPKIDTDAFLIADITGWEEHNLQPGNANIHFENNFIGETFFNPQTDSDTLQVSLGRDKRIVVKRELLKDVGSNQLIGSNRTRSFSYETSIRNNRKESIAITLEDQIPVSRDKDIEVKLLENSGGDYNEVTGKVTWKLEVAPATQVKKILGFQVKYPKDRRVMGL